MDFETLDYLIISTGTDTFPFLESSFKKGLVSEEECLFLNEYPAGLENFFFWEEVIPKGMAYNTVKRAGQKLAKTLTEYFTKQPQLIFLLTEGRPEEIDLILSVLQIARSEDIPVLIIPCDGEIMMTPDILPVDYFNEQTSIVIPVELYTPGKELTYERFQERISTSLEILLEIVSIKKPDTQYITLSIEELLSMVNSYATLTLARGNADSTQGWSEAWRQIIEEMPDEENIHEGPDKVILSYSSMPEVDVFGEAFESSSYLVSNFYGKTPEIMIGVKVSNEIKTAMQIDLVAGFN